MDTATINGNHFLPSIAPDRHFVLSDDVYDNYLSNYLLVVESDYLLLIDTIKKYFKNYVTTSIAIKQ